MKKISPTTRLNDKLSAKLLLCFFAALLAVIFYVQLNAHQANDAQTVAAEEDSQSAYSEDITDVVHEFENGMRIYTEHHDDARIPFITVYKYPVIDEVTGAAVPPPENVGGTNYYRVISTNADEDTGDEVCAIALNTACTGYVDESVTGFSVCKAFHPTASEVTDVNGDISVTYCNGNPQAAPCNALSNTCLSCPTCTNGVACNEAIGGLYREMYVTCAASSAVGTDLCSAGLDDDDGSGDGILDLTATETTFDNTSIIVDGCDIAIDGTHTFTNVTVRRNGSITQSETGTGTFNTTNITVTGHTEVAIGSSISVKGKGVSGQFHVNPSISTTTPQAGARNTHAATVSTDPSEVYGDYFNPIYPGSGGSNVNGDGGGVLNLTLNTLELEGEINADSNNPGGCGGTSGSGGSIKMTISGEMTGDGSITANALPCTNTISDGSGGRIAIFYTTSGGINTLDPIQEYTIQSVNEATNDGVPGTIYLEDTSQVGVLYNANEARLIVDEGTFSHEKDGGGVVSDDLNVVLPASVTLYQLEIDDARITMAPTAAATLTITDTLDIRDGAELTYTDMDSLGLIKKLVIDATNATVQVDATSSIDARGKGALPNQQIQPSTSTTNAVAGHNTSHGGLGGDTASLSDTYGDFWDPQWPGSGSFTASPSGRGGGVIDITAETFTHNGTIRADGNVYTCNPPPGSGGSVKITTTGNLSGNGVIQANAGGCLNTISQSGAGRVAFYYTTLGGINPTPPNQLFTLQARNEDIQASLLDGSPGTIYVEDSNAVTQGTYNTGEGILIIDNGSTDVGNVNGVPLLGTVNLYELYINHANVTADNLIVENVINLTDDARLKPRAMVTLGPIYRLILNSPNADLTIDSTSFIDAQGRGTVGTDQIDPDISTTNAIDGANTSHGGVGGTDASEAYGDFFDPIYPGSGGSFSGSRAGGVIDITVDTLDLEGAIRASANSHGGCGGTAASGGSVKITVGGAYTGSGAVEANGGNCTNSSSTASGGRVAFFYTTAGSINSTAPDQQFTLSAYAIDGATGAAGTVYVEDANAITLGTYSANEGRLIVRNDTALTGTTGAPILGTVNLYELLVDNARVTAETLAIENTVTLQNGALMRHELMTSLGPIKRLTINGPNANLSIDATSSINVRSGGTLGAQSIDPQISTTNAVNGANRGHGGVFGTDFTLSYGDFRDPIYPGSGGSFSSRLGAGSVIISVQDFDLDGTINASANSGGGCGGNYGSGGGIKVTTSGELTGSGTLEAEGSRCTNSGTQTNGGGRIAFFYDSDPSGAVTNNSPETIYTFDTTFDIVGTNPAGPGTTYIEDDNATNGDTDGQGDLIIDGESQSSLYSTPLFNDETPTSLTLTNVTVINGADLILTSPCTGTLTVTGTIDLSGGGSITDNTAGACATSFASLSITPALPDGNINTAYSEQVQSPGGFAPKTFECLDGLGGSVIACNAAAGWPTGITMSATGLVSGTPTVGGTFNPIIRVTDSDPGGAQVAEQTMSLFVNSAPNEPTLVLPADASQVGTALPTVSAQYSDPDSGDTGTTNYRISSGSAADCLNNLNIVDSGTSAATATNNEATTYTVGVNLSHAATYNWCAQNNDGSALSNSGNFTTMGSFTVNLGNPPNEPVLVAPGDTDTTNLVSPLLEANYSDPDSGDTGTIEFRVSSGSAADCLSNTNVVFIGSSAQTTTNNETASVTVGIALTNLATYNWCARSNDGIFTSNSGNFTTMGSFLVDTSFTPGGSLGTILNQQTPGGGGDGGDSSDPDELVDPLVNDIQSFGVSLSFKDINNVSLPDEVQPDRIVFGTITLTNTNNATATDVFMNLPLPEFIDYVPSSLQINGEAQSDLADEDPGQANSNAISAIWSSLGPNVSRSITFQLLTRSTAKVAALETLQLQATVSASNADQLFLSNEEVINLFIDDSTPQDSDTPDPDSSDTDPDPIPADDPLPSDPGDDSSPDTPDDSGQDESPADTPDDSSDSDPSDDAQPDSSDDSSDAVVPDSTDSTDDGGLPPGLQPTPQIPQGPIIPLGPSTDDDQDQPGGQSEDAGDDDLFITGNVQSQNEQIEFSGTVNEPNTEVIVIINNESYTVISDENGFWRAFVSAEEIGVQENTTQQIDVEAYAVNTETGEQSNTIQQQIFVERIGEELVIEEITSTESSNTAVRVIDTFTSQVQDIIEEREEEIQTTLVVTAPLVAVSSISIWGYLPYLPTMLFHFISWILGLFGRKKQDDERFYGIVYDSLSKQPIALAIVRIYKQLAEEAGVHDHHSQVLVKTVVTDKAGRYEALLEPGDYTIDVRKPQFTFPSSIVVSGPDGDYQHIYQGSVVSQGDSVLIPDIPLDPENAPKKWQTGSFLQRFWYAIQKVGHAIAVPVLFIGAFASVLTLIANPESTISWILAIIYVLLLIMQITFRLHPAKPWGVVYDIATNAVVPLTTLQLIDPEFGKVISTRLSDYEGRFNFLPDPGEYIVKATKEGYKQSEVIDPPKGREIMKEKISISEQGQKIDGDIGLKQE